jgi:hypothetical protein
VNKRPFPSKIRLDVVPLLPDIAACPAWVR